MSKKLAKSPEHWAMDVFGDMLTKGGIDIVKKLWVLFIKLNASIPLVFFRYRMGTRFLSGATLFWGYMMMTLCWMVEETFRTDTSLATGQAPSGDSSLGLFVLTIVAFGIVGMYHLFESRRNLRRADGKGQPRYSGDPGLSFLWMPVKRLLEPFGLIPSSGEPPRWWQMNEYKFQKFVEPILILVIGILFRKLGYSAFGAFIAVCGCCAFLYVAHIEDNYFEMKQDSWDAEVLSGVVQHRDEPIERTQGAIIQQSIIRSDRKGFEEWHESSRQETYFDVTANVVPTKPAA